MPKFKKGDRVIVKNDPRILPEYRGKQAIVIYEGYGESSQIQFLDTGLQKMAREDLLLPALSPVKEYFLNLKERLL